MNDISNLDSKYNCHYSNDFKRNYLIKNLLNKYSTLVNLSDICKVFSLCGRIIKKRNMGKASFLELQDFSGKIQLYVSENFFGLDYKDAISNINIGDIVGVKGKLFKTNTGELSLKINYLKILSKILNSYPDKWNGLVDKELCYRYRYIDLMVNFSTRNLFIIRSKIINKIRYFFLKKDFLEVETPMFHFIPGGASAKPFITHHNYSSLDLYLRISPELYLKRLVVGGFEKVFEIGKSFRNEGVSNKHNPEFTMIEFYEAYSNYKKMMKLTEKLFRFLSKEIIGNYIISYMGHNIDFSSSFKKISFKDAILKYNPMLDNDSFFDIYKIIDILKKQGFNSDFDMSLSDLHCKLFDLTVEKNLIDPTFVIFYPVEISPLARRCSFDDSLTERFELYICGKEIANGFSELNDPNDQSNRFIDQLKNSNNNNDLHYDDDYINALRYGLPPTAGEGIGIDRLVMLFTDSSSIKDVIFFPIMKKK